MNGFELFRLGRKLAKVGVLALPPSGFRDLSTSVRLVLVDILENPNTTIGQVVERTGFPQSHVSASVSKLREAGVLTTRVDPDDKRCTRVAPSKEHLARAKSKQESMPSIENMVLRTLIELHGPDGAKHLDAATEALTTLHTLFGLAEPVRTEA